MGRKTFVSTLCIVIALLFCAPNVIAETLIIGADSPLSGPAASWGLGQTRALEMLIDDINAKGGLKVGDKTYKMELLAYDNKANAAEAASIAKKLIYDKKVKYILSAAVGATGRAIQTVTVPNKVLFMFSCWGKNLLGKLRPLNFRNGHSPFEMADAYIAAVIKANPNIKTMATFSPNDTSGWDGAKGVISAAQKAGIKVVAEEYYQRGTTDFHAILTKVLAKKPDMLEVAASPMATGGIIFKQAYEMGYRGAKGWLAGSNPSIAIKIAGVDATDGIYLGVNWDYLAPKFTLPELKEVYLQYKKKYGEDWDYYGMSNYVGAKIVFDTMQRIKSIDPEKVADAIVANQPYNSIFGPVIYGNASVYGLDRNLIHPLVLGQIKKGKIENASFGLHPDLKKKVGDWKFPE